ncbi:MAG: hypothetical protein HFJ34_00925 [Clostridia bacterium]|nr:hypothetical protein [Clostridia bacterium]
MKKRTKENSKKFSNKGITLIALVITIIVLLILAGVSIASLTGENGLLNKSEQAKEKYEYRTAYEILNLKISEANIEKQRKCTLEELEQFLSREDEIDVIVMQYNKTAKKSNQLGEYPTGKLINIVVNVVQYPNYYFLIGESGTIEKISNNGGNTFIDSEEFDPTLPPKQVNNDWNQLLDLGGIDSSYNSYEEALKDKEVIDAIIKNEQAIDYLVDATDDLINTSINNVEFLKELAQNEESAKKILASDNWNQILENNENANIFYENINIENSEELTQVEEENPYFTFVAKANHKYFIQCYGAQGGTFNFYGMYNQGGYGGYSYGILNPTQDLTLYIYKGGAGAGTIANSSYLGGYNGGGSIGTWHDGNELQATGGGATHIAIQKGLLQELEFNQSSILMVAGGGRRFWS